MYVPLAGVLNDGTFQAKSTSSPSKVAVNPVTCAGTTPSVVAEVFADGVPLPTGLFAVIR